jgi:hypothetical protein
LKYTRHPPLPLLLSHIDIGYSKRVGYWKTGKGKFMRALFESVARNSNLDPLLPDTWYKISRKDIKKVKVCVFFFFVCIHYPSFPYFSFFLPLPLSRFSFLVSRFSFLVSRFSFLVSSFLRFFVSRFFVSRFFVSRFFVSRFSFSSFLRFFVSRFLFGFSFLLK